MASSDTISATSHDRDDVADYGDEIPLSFMDVNHGFAIVIMAELAAAALVGTFGNVLILVAVVTQRQLRSVESVLVINLACCDLYVTMLAGPLSIVAKTVGWRMFEGVPGLCRVIGYLCTLSCVGSLMTLSIMSLNRYVLICHHTLYAIIFTTRKCLFFCVLIYVFGFFLISFNFFGIGDHAFDYKSYECVWDRMASHDYTIVFAIVLVWVPIIITGLAYSRTYRYVRRVRTNITKGLGVKAKEESKGDSDGREGENNGAGREIIVNVQAWKEAEEKEMGERQSRYTTDSSDVTDVDVHRASLGDQNGVDISGHRSLAQDRLRVPAAATHSKASSVILTKHDNTSTSSTDGQTKKLSFSNRTSSTSTTATLTVTPTTYRRSVKFNTSNATTTGLHPGLKLARPLFIIYVVFSTCWIPYSIVIIADRSNRFPHEVHAFITAFAHLNSSVNWLVYYYTHNKMRQAFRRLLGLRQKSSSPPSPSFLTKG